MADLHVETYKTCCLQHASTSSPRAQVAHQNAQVSHAAEYLAAQLAGQLVARQAERLNAGHLTLLTPGQCLLLHPKGGT